MQAGSSPVVTLAVCLQAPGGRVETRGMAQQETETDFSPIPIVSAHCLLWSRSRVYKDRVTVNFLAIVPGFVYAFFHLVKGRVRKGVIL